MPAREDHHSLPCCHVEQHSLSFQKASFQKAERGNLDMEGLTPPKVSQRIPLACANCTKSKVRCEKTLPCARCRRRGIDCARIQVVQNKRRSRDYERSIHRETTSSDRTEIPSIQIDLPSEHASIHRDDHDEEVAHSVTLQAQSRSVSSAAVCDSVADRAAQVDQSERLPLVPRSTSRLPTMSYNHDSSPAGRQSSLLLLSSNSRQDQNLSDDLATAVEGLAWGRHQCQHYPHTSCTGSAHFANLSAIKPLSTAISSVMPSTASGKCLVEYHIQHLLWDHNVLHTSTFISECAEYWDTGSMPKPQWAALYLAVLSTAAWSLENARERPDFVDSLSTPLLGSSYTFFDCMIDVFKKADLWNIIL